MKVYQAIIITTIAILGCSWEVSANPIDHHVVVKESQKIVDNIKQETSEIRSVACRRLAHMSSGNPIFLFAWDAVVDDDTVMYANPDLVPAANYIYENLRCNTQLGIQLLNNIKE